MKFRKASKGRMKRNIRLTFGKGDAVIVVSIVLMAVFIGVLFQLKIEREQADAVVIYQNGEKIQELSLKENREVVLSNHYTNRVEIKEGKVSITQSDCPGEDCVHSGWISKPGRSIVCLPNRVEIRIEGSAEVDFIVH